MLRRIYTCYAADFTVIEMQRISRRAPKGEKLPQFTSKLPAG
jgi:hypothetical protein